ncbi:hypothetical protein AGMMS50293_06910 [Spirochaetia bacterium]|nr:hypothetical protein AGMMS50293_06910 [Spirochaetia bacterium]
MGGAANAPDCGIQAWAIAACGKDAECFGNAAAYSHAFLYTSAPVYTSTPFQCSRIYFSLPAPRVSPRISEAGQRWRGRIMRVNTAPQTPRQSASGLPWGLLR